MKKVRKPKAPPIGASESRWNTYRKKLAEYKKFQKAMDARRKLRDNA